MLEKPHLDDEALMACVRDAFGVDVVEIAFLPLGNDEDTAVYRALGEKVAKEGRAYFCKLRRGDFDECSVLLPHFLREQAIHQIIAPLLTHTGKLWAEFPPFNVILYPFVEGISGYEVELTEAQWADFGAAMKGIHSSVLPPSLLQKIEKEQFSPEWRAHCRTLMGLVLAEGTEDGIADGFADPIGRAARALLSSQQELILYAIERAEALAQAMSQKITRQLAAGEFPFVLCHNDIHPGNLLLEAPQKGGRLFVVDWDYPILAPKERDLMFIGGGQGFIANEPEREQALFYGAYGEAEIDLTALAYYRFERAIYDIAVDGERILSPTLGDKDRAQSLEILGFYFLPGCPLEMARKVDKVK